MKKKVVYLSYDFMGYEKEVIKLLEDVMGFEVYFINALKYEYKYKNKLEKLLNNLYYKPFYKKNLKDIKFDEIIINKLKEIGEVDYYFTIRADKFSHKIFQHIKEKEKPMYLHHWDSFSFIDKQVEFLKYFDCISSFDKNECEKYNMKFIPNFYLEKNIMKRNEKKYDYFTVMKYDYRFPLLEKLAKHLKNKNIKYKFIVITKEKIKSDYVDIYNEYIPLEKTYEYLSKSEGIVEIGHTKDLNSKYQGGASFRIADAIGNKQKIITNYKFMEKYDIYDENNIFVIDNEINKNFSKFLNFGYKDYSKEIYEKYSGENWIKSIFGGR